MNLFKSWITKIADVPLWSRWLLLASCMFLAFQMVGFVEIILTH